MSEAQTIQQLLGKALEQAGYNWTGQVLQNAQELGGIILLQGEHVKGTKSLLEALSVTHAGKEGEALILQGNDVLHIDTTHFDIAKLKELTGQTAAKAEAEVGHATVNFGVDYNAAGAMPAETPSKASKPATETIHDTVNRGGTADWSDRIQRGQQSDSPIR